MRATLYQLQSGENDLELLALGTSAGAAASGFAWVAAGLPLPQCAFHVMTGCPCPTCGATRCLLALLHGHVGEALAWNPLVFAGILGIVLLDLYSAAVLAAGFPRFRLSLAGAEARVLRVGSVILVASNWAYLIHRGV